MGFTVDCGDRNASSFDSGAIVDFVSGGLRIRVVGTEDGFKRAVLNDLNEPVNGLWDMYKNGTKSELLIIDRIKVRPTYTPKK